MTCTHPNHKNCTSDDCSDGCKKQRGTLWRKREITNLQTHVIDSITMVCIYRNAEGTVIASTEAEGLTNGQIAQMYNPDAPLGVDFETFTRIVRATEKELGLKEPT